VLARSVCSLVFLPVMRHAPTFLTVAAGQGKVGEVFGEAEAVDHYEFLAALQIRDVGSQLVGGAKGEAGGVFVGHASMLTKDG